MKQTCRIIVEDDDGWLTDVTKTNDTGLEYAIADAIEATGSPRKCQLIAQIIDYMADGGQLDSLNEINPFVDEMIDASRRIIGAWEHHDKRLSELVQKKG